MTYFVHLFLGILTPLCQVLAHTEPGFTELRVVLRFPALKGTHLLTEVAQALLQRRRDHRLEKDQGMAGSKATSFSSAIRLGPFLPSDHVAQLRSKLALGWCHCLSKGVEAFIIPERPGEGV